MVKVFLVSDDRETATATAGLLQEAGHECLLCSSKSGLVNGICGSTADLLLIDARGIDMPCADLIRVIRSGWTHASPIIAMGGDNDERHVADALNAGADDYLAGAVRPLELLARVSAVCRRAGTSSRSAGSIVRAGPYELNCHGQFVNLESTRISLTQKEFELALLLFTNPGRVLSNTLIERTVWGFELDNRSRALAGLISRLRRTLRMGPKTGAAVTPVYSHGYRFDASLPQVVVDPAQQT